MRNIIISSLDRARISERMKEVKYQNAYTLRELEKLQQELDRARVLEPQQIPESVITMNSVVTVEYLTTGKEFTIQLVYPEDANAKENRISIFAPVGSALLGYRKGDTIHWSAPGGTIKIKVKDVVSQPEAVGSPDA